MGSQKLVDYFVISGLDAEKGLEPDQLCGDSLHCSPLDRPYKSHTLAHYPESIPTNLFDADAVRMVCQNSNKLINLRLWNKLAGAHKFVMMPSACNECKFLCHPHGLHFQTDQEPRQTAFHTFMITKEDGSRIYGATLTFYERVDNVLICNAMQTLQDMHQAELSNAQSRTLYPSHLSPAHSISQSSSAQSSPAHSKNSPIGAHLRSTEVPAGVHQRRSGQSPSRATLRSPARVPNTPTAMSLPDTRTYHMSCDILYATRCICVISRLPFVDVFHKFLQSLYSIVLSPPLAAGSITSQFQQQQQQQLSIGSYVYNVLHEVPMPQPGGSIRISLYNNQTVVCQRPGINELPLLDYPLRILFELFDVSEVLTAFTGILLEHQILICSHDFQRLMLVAEAFTALIFPFQWQHVYVPILPASMHHFLDAPIPFIMGMLTSADTESCSKATMCVVNIDTGIVDKPEDLPLFPYSTQLRLDIEQELRRHRGGGSGEEDLNGSHQRDSGFVRDSFIAPEFGSTTTVSGSIFGSSSGVSSASGADNSCSTWSLSAKMAMLEQNDALARITALAKKTGVVSSLDDIRDSVTDAAITAHKSSKGLGGGGGGGPESGGSSKGGAGLSDHTRDLIFNSAVREIFLHYMLHIFGGYEQFVVLPTTRSMESWLSTRETTQNFDKTSFLSDQSAEHLLFLSPFTETQMFTSFIDSKILAHWGNTEEDGCVIMGEAESGSGQRNLAVWENRLKTFKEDQMDQRLRRFYRTAAAKESESIIEKRATNAETAPAPHRLVDEPADQICPPGFFPLLPAAVINKEPASTRLKAHEKWRNHHGIRLRGAAGTFKQRDEYIGKTLLAKVPLRGQPIADLKPTAMVNTNLKFMETLLKECKAKTKRMLVQKMGQEAVDLGHGEVTVVGVEENMLIASLCDLLDRIWSHGLQQKQRRSALWFHLVSFQTAAEQASRKNSNQTPNSLEPGSQESLGGESGGEGGGINGMQTWPLRHHRRKPSRGPELPVLDPLPISLLADLRNVRQMSEIMTDVGYSRAFVRLSLEKKLLSKHLKELLSNADLLREVYKRYAFLRCEEEREQFLYHLLSLNAVDYFCFTNSYTSTVLTYRILVFPRIKLSGGATTANCWVSLAGHLGETAKIDLPKHTLDITIQNKNLGVLTTMRVGHDNAGISPKWMVEHVLVRSEVTGHTYRFPCGRWLGKGADDGALERLLVAEPVPATVDANELLERCRTPPRCRSPSVPRRASEPRLMVSDIQQQLSDAVNNLLKHLCKLEKERGSTTGSVTGLLCGEYGLVFCMEHVFQYGFRSARLFRGRFFIWDFLERVVCCLEPVMLDRQRYNLDDQTLDIMDLFCHVINVINQASESIGKDERFQIFICIGVRDRLLQKWLKMIRRTSVAASMYEERSFLRDSALIDSIIQILESLNEFSITLESSLIKGVKL